MKKKRSMSAVALCAFIVLFFLSTVLSCSADKKSAQKQTAPKPAAKKQAAKKPGAKRQAAKKQAAKKQVAKKPGAKKQVAKKPAGQKQVAQKPAGQKAVAQKPAAGTAVAQKSATGTAGTAGAQKTAAGTPAAQKPAAGTAAQTAAAAGTAATQKPDPTKPVTVKGVIASAVKNKDGKVIEIQITVGKEKYMVAANAKGREMVKLIGKTVEATGTIEVKPNGNKTITVRIYRIV